MNYTRRMERRLGLRFYPVISTDGKGNTYRDGVLVVPPPITKDELKQCCDPSFKLPPHNPAADGVPSPERPGPAT